MRHVAAALIAVVLAGASSTPRGEAPPPEAREHKRDVTREVRVAHGLDGPVSAHAALIHQESSWRSDAESPAGARGLAQLMPSAEEHVEQILGTSIDPYTPAHAIRAVAHYTAWLRGQIESEQPWSMVMSAYNGGIGHLRRDRELAAQDGADPGKWWCHVEHYTERSPDAKQENRRHVRRVIIELQPAYRRAGWPGPEVL